VLGDPYVVNRTRRVDRHFLLDDPAVAGACRASLVRAAAAMAAPRPVAPPPRGW
jgi:hypothetical protein